MSPARVWLHAGVLLGRVTRQLRPERAGRQDDAGFTLIEMLVALGVLGILMLPLAGTFYSAQSTDAQNRANGDAVALADSALAKADALSWQSLGFYEDQFGACGSTIPSYGSQAGVDLGCHPVGTAVEAIQHVDSSLTVGRVQFTLTTYVVKATASGSCAGSPCTSAEKQVYAVVSWSLGGLPLSVTETILVYPGSLGTYKGGLQETPSGSTPPPSVGGITCLDPTSGLPTSCTAASVVGYNSFKLGWSDPGAPEPGWYEIVIQNSSAQPTADSWSTVPNDQNWDPTGTTVLGGVAAPATSDLVTGLSPSTTYSFVVVAFSPDGSLWAVSQQALSVTTPSAPPTACQLTSIAVNQTGQTQIDTVTLKSGNGSSAGHMMNTVSMTVAFQGSCTSGNNVVVSATGPGALGPYQLTYSSSPAQFTYNPPAGLCPSASFATGTYVFSATLDGAAQSPSANVSFSSASGSAKC